MSVANSVLKSRTRLNEDGTEHLLLGRAILKVKPSRKRARRTDHKFSKEILRLREIEAVIRHRHGVDIPDPDGTDDASLCLAYIEAAAGACTDQDMFHWCRRWAPWASASDIERVFLLSAKRRRMIPADSAAKMLCLSMNERTELGIKTIGACDLTKAKRTELMKERKRERDRQRQERIRRSEGRVDRKSHAAQTLAATQPWKALGISRRTWFYRQKANCTEVSRIVSTKESDTSVQTEQFPPVPPSSLLSSAARVTPAGGLGHQAPAGLQGAVPHGSHYIRSESRS